MKYAAVLGHPIAHSLSPILHNAAYQALGLDWQYTAIDVEPADLPTLLAEKLLGRDDWAGFSVTMPLKPEIVPWLTSGQVQKTGAQAEISPLVTATGAANTLVKIPKDTGLAGHQTRLLAENTDVAGIVEALREVIRHGPVEKIAILGSGATAASALAAAMELGAELVAVYARPSDSQKQLREVAARLGITEQKIHAAKAIYRNTELVERDLAEAAKELPDFDAVISTMPKHAADAIAANLTHVGGALLDVVYDPRPTDLLAAWSALGGAIVGGERMLLHQAARQVELMTDCPAPIAAMDVALQASLGGYTARPLGAEVLGNLNRRGPL
ncbi:MAG: shikimate dehydrogenase [Cellulomonadaceae bacterium]|jgi:shikimate dehydrogenase|nr:shikimate dehydrogenase [Cellulomonadaceae bacterium]